MIKPKKLNAVTIAVRDLDRSLKWYREHFGFERLFDVEGGVVIGADGVELVVSQVGDPAHAPLVNHAVDVCVRLFAFEVTEEDFARVKDEFPEDKDIVEIDHPRYKSYITEDLDGHCIELYVDKAA